MNCVQEQLKGYKNTNKPKPEVKLCLNKKTYNRESEFLFKHPFSLNPN